jgi:MFS family permease
MAMNKKAESGWRWVVLALTCLMMIGNYYSYDNPAALKTQIEDYMGDPSDYETLYSLLYTVYSIPNVFLPFFGGYFVDKWGVRICMLIFCCFIATGQCIFSLGLSVKSWPVMYVGRIIFGFGGESLSVANSAILADWFEGKELAFAFGLNLSIARLGSVINNLVSPPLANSVSVVFALWFSAILCGGSVCAALAIAPIDRSFEDEENAAKPKLVLDENAGITNPLLEDEGLSVHDIDSNRRTSGNGKPVVKTEGDSSEKQEIEFKEVFTFSLGFWLLVVSCLVVYGCVLPFNNVASSLLLERDYFMEPDSDCVLLDMSSAETADSESNCGTQGDSCNYPVDCPSSKWYQPPLPDSCQDGNGKQYNNLKSSDIDCTADEWTDKGSCGYYYCVRQESATVQATTIMSIPYIISACMSPILGKLVDTIGRRAIIATMAPLVLIFVHGSLALSDMSPIVPLVGQGLAYAGFAAVLWPSVPLVVEKRLTGLAYGVCTAIQNIGLATFPLIVAAIYQVDEEYIPNVEFFFMSLACLGTLVGFYLNYYDAKHDNIFNRTSVPEDEFDAISGGRDSEYRSYSKGSFSQGEAANAIRVKTNE